MLGLLVLIAIPIVVVCALVSTIYVAPKKIIRNIEGDHTNLICFNHKSDDIIITIDDIPYKNVKNLIEIVNILNENGAKATFFLIGSFVNESNEHVICDMIKAGHHIANHGMYDKRALTTDVNVLKQEIIECKMIINELYKKSGVSQPQINYYRPGCGLFTKKIEAMVTELGYKIVLGSVFPFDPHVPISEINFLYIKLKLQPKDILILHDRSWTISLFKKMFEDPILSKYCYKNLEQLKI